MKLRWRLAGLALYPLARLFLRLRVAGRERLGRGAQILAANHVSNLDPLLVGLAAGREVHFLAKEELFLPSRAFAWLIKTWNAWPVRRGGGDLAAIRRCSWLLRQGQTVVLFPEGTRSRTGEMAHFKPGIGMLAVANGVPVVPTRIWGVERSLISYLADRDFVRRGYRAKPRKSFDIGVAFGKPVSPREFGRDREGYERLAEAVEARVRELGRCRE